MQFRVPKDEEVFKLRDEALLRKERLLDELKAKKVFALFFLCTSHIQIWDRPRLNAYKQAPIQCMKPMNSSRRRSPTDTPADVPDVGIESVALFVKRSRELFDLQLAVTFKRDEMVRLDADLKQRRLALDHDVSRLESDIREFDDALARSDQSAQSAIQAADKARTEKEHLLAKIKQVRTELGAVHQLLDSGDD